MPCNIFDTYWKYACSKHDLFEMCWREARNLEANYSTTIDTVLKTNFIHWRANTIARVGYSYLLICFLLAQVVLVLQVANEVYKYERSPNKECKIEYHFINFFQFRKNLLMYEWPSCSNSHWFSNYIAS